MAQRTDPLQGSPKPAHWRAMQDTMQAIQEGNSAYTIFIILYDYCIYSLSYKFVKKIAQRLTNNQTSSVDGAD